jgi:hypothetical protein
MLIVFRTPVRSIDATAMACTAGLILAAPAHYRLLVSH